MPTLFPFLPFDPVETPVSYATRLAAFHTGGRLLPFLHDIGVKPKAFAAGDTEAVELLCAVAGIDSAPVLHNTARTVGKRRSDLRSEELSVEFLSGSDTVFCPLCLAEDHAAANGNPRGRRQRLSWALRVVRTCPQHQIALLRRKRQNEDNRFHELAVRVPERGETLVALAESCERRPVSPLQDYVMTRLEGGAGPEWLDQHPIEQAVRATEMLGLLIAFGPVAMPSEQGVSDWDCAGRIGFDYTSARESGIREALRQAQAAYRGKGLPKRFNVFGGFYRWLASPKTRKEVGDIKRIMREHILETMEVAPNEIILGGSIPQRRLHSVKSLALEAKLQPRTLRRLLAARGVIPSDEKIDEYHVFDAEVGRAVAASAHRLIDVQALPKTLNCTRPQAGQLLDEQLLVRVGGAPSDHRAGSREL